MMIRSLAELYKPLDEFNDTKFCTESSEKDQVVKNGKEENC